MSSGSFTRRGFRFEPITALSHIISSVDSGRIPTIVEFNPNLPGQPDCHITYSDYKTDWIQVKSRSVGQGQWTPNEEDIVKAIFNFCVIDAELSKAKKSGAYADFDLLLFLEGEPNSKLTEIIKAIETPSDPESLELLLNQSAKWIESPHWKSKEFNQSRVASTAMKLTIVSRLDKQFLEDFLFEKLGSFYHDFMRIEAEKDKFEETDLADILDFISSKTNEVLQSLDNLEKAKLPRNVKDSLEYLIRQRIILYFSKGRESGIDNTMIDGIAYASKKSFLLLYSEQIIRGRDLVHLVAEKVIPSKREAIIFAANDYSLMNKGIHLIDMDSTTINEELSRIIMGNE